MKEPTPPCPLCRRPRKIEATSGHILHKSGCNSYPLVWLFKCAPCGLEVKVMGACGGPEVAGNRRAYLKLLRKLKVPTKPETAWANYLAELDGVE